MKKYLLKEDFQKWKRLNDMNFGELIISFADRNKENFDLPIEELMMANIILKKCRKKFIIPNAMSEKWYSDSGFPLNTKLYEVKK